MQITPYQFTPEPVDPAASKLLPFKDLPGEIWTVLNAITVACEQGKLTQNGWVSQCFADNDVFDEFLEAFEEFGRIARIHDRWYDALRRLAAAENEEGFVSASEIAEKLDEAASSQ